MGGGEGRKHNPQYCAAALAKWLLIHLPLAVLAFGEPWGALTGFPKPHNMLKMQPLPTSRLQSLNRKWVATNTLQGLGSPAGGGGCLVSVELHLVEVHSFVFKVRRLVLGCVLE